MIGEGGRYELLCSLSRGSATGSQKNRPDNRAHRFRRPRTLPPRVCSNEFRLAPYRLHVAEPASRLSDARVRERLLDGAVQHDGVLLRLHGGRVPTRRTAQRVLAEPVLQHAAAATGQTLGVIERRQVSAGQRPFRVTRGCYVIRDPVHCATQSDLREKEKIRVLIAIVSRTPGEQTGDLQLGRYDATQRKLIACDRDVA